MKEDINEDLLIRYILDEANADEREYVETWLQGHPDHVKHFEQTRFLLDSSKRLAQSSPLTGEQAWERFKNKRNEGRNEKGKVVPISSITNWFRIAAVALLFIGGGWLTYYLYNGKSGAAKNWVTLKAEKQVRVDTLPDGSIVHINKRSTLAYHGNFRSNREVKLTGEAFFDVKHDDAAPFTVQVDDIYVRDVGTAFNIKNRQHNTEVIVASGVVEVSKNKDAVQLTEQQMVIINAGAKNFKVEKNIDELYNYYVSNTFTANNTALWRLIDVLNEAYTADIRIENSALRNAPITAPIRLQESLDDILEVIRLTTPGMQVQKAGNRYIIK